MKRSNWIQRGLHRFAESARLRPLWNLFYRAVNRLTKCGPLAHYPGLYFPYARLFKPGDFWKLPNPSTDLLIESAGAAASHAFRAYVEQHNPDLKLAYGCEVYATLRYALDQNLPAMVLTRDKAAFITSVTERFPQISLRNAEAIHDDFHSRLKEAGDAVLVIDYDRVIAGPAGVIKELNEKFGLSLNEGDNRLPQIRTTQSTKPESLKA